MAWQWVSPASRRYLETETGIERRYHLHESAFQRIFKRAVPRSGVSKPATPHSTRQSFATYLLERGYDIRTLQELRGHKDVSTTMIYCHVLNRGGLGVHSPADLLSNGLVRKSAQSFVGFNDARLESENR